MKGFPALILPPGALRLLLAGLVVWSHFAMLAGVPLLTPLEGVGVFGFFFLSGYWVACLWDSRYVHTRAPLLTFCLSRALRIYPQATIVTLLMFVLVGATWSNLVWNLLLFGVQFGGAIDPPVWTLGLELQFYAIAPLLFVVLRNRYVLAAVLVLGMVFFVRFCLGLTGTYIYHFIVPFALGIVYSYKPRHDLAVKLAPWSLLAVVVFAVATNFDAVKPFVPLDYRSDAVRRLTVMFFHLISLPFVAASLSIRSTPFDRALGDLAYPVYLLHWPMFVLASLIPPIAGVPAALGLTAASSLAMFWLVDRPLEALRHSVIERRSLARPAPGQSRLQAEVSADNPGKVAGVA
jgi:peptidoglycan/LPS O-acetylase OafA/YrhL